MRPDGPEPAAGARALGAHLDEGEAHAFVDGALGDEAAAQVIAHVAACDRCAGLLAGARGLAAAATRILGALDDVPGGVVPAVPTAVPTAVSATLASGTLAAAPPARPVAAPVRVVRPSAPVRRWARWPVRAAAALLLAAGVGSAAWRARRETSPARDEVAATSVNAPSPAPAAAPLSAVGAPSAGDSTGLASAYAGSPATNGAASAPRAGPTPPRNAARAPEARVVDARVRADVAAKASVPRTAQADAAPVSGPTVLTPPVAPPPPPAMAAVPRASVTDTLAADRARAGAPPSGALASGAELPRDSFALPGAAAARRARMLRSPVAVAEAADVPAGAGCYTLTGLTGVRRVSGVALSKRVTLEPVPAAGRDGVYALTPVPARTSATWTRLPGDSLRLRWESERGGVAELRVGTPDARGVRHGEARAAGADGADSAADGAPHPATVRSAPCRPAGRN